MRYKLFGKSGLRVSELCLGTTTFGAEGWGTPKKECRKVFEVFAEGGGNFIDCADIYGRGTSEEWVGEFIATDRAHFVVSTKYTTALRTGDPNYCGNHRKYMMKALEASLRRLNTDYIDIYWLHFWDFTTPVEEVMRALDDAVRAGKILYVGASNTPAWIVSQANTMSELRGWTPFVGLQIQYSLAKRTVERELLPMANSLGMAVTCWQPLGGSVLTNDSQELRLRLGYSRFQQPSERDFAIGTVVAKIAKEIGHSPAQVALNWLRQQEGTVIPIMGVRNLKHIKENMACLDFSLTEDLMRRLDDVSKIELEYPYETLEDRKEVVYGGMFSSIDNPSRGVLRQAAPAKKAQLEKDNMKKNST